MGLGFDEPSHFHEKINQLPYSPRQKIVMPRIGDSVISWVLIETTNRLSPKSKIEHLFLIGIANGSEKSIVSGCKVCKCTGGEKWANKWDKRIERAGVSGCARLYLATCQNAENHLILTRNSYGSSNFFLFHNHRENAARIRQNQLIRSTS